MKAPVDTLDRPLQDLRISVTDACNYRCPYCMPESEFDKDYQFLSPRQRLSFAEIQRLSLIFTTLGVTKIRITGGEPLLRRGIDELVRELSAIGTLDDLALTTNGQLLSQYAEKLKQAGLMRITVSLDSLRPERFRRLSGGRGALEQVFTGIQTARSIGLQPVKINSVIQRGVNEDEVVELAERFRRSGAILRFIEYMDVGNCNGWDRTQVVAAAEIRDRVHQRWPLEPLPAHYSGEVASRYAYRDGGGEIGFVTSISQPFCQDCSRGRLSADGKFYTCLFATNGLDLRARLRAGESDGQIRQAIYDFWLQRGDCYSELRSRAQQTPASRAGRRIEMFYIGG